MHFSVWFKSIPLLTSCVTHSLSPSPQQVLPSPSFPFSLQPHRSVPPLLVKWKADSGLHKMPEQTLLCSGRQPSFVVKFLVTISHCLALFKIHFDLWYTGKYPVQAVKRVSQLTSSVLKGLDNLLLYTILPFFFQSVHLLCGKYMGRKTVNMIKLSHTHGVFTYTIKKLYYIIV